MEGYRARRRRAEGGEGARTVSYRPGDWSPGAPAQPGCSGPWRQAAFSRFNVSPAAATGELYRSTSPRTVMATWVFEPGHTAAGFCARHMMVCWVRGHFKDVHGSLE